MNQFFKIKGLFVLLLSVTILSSCEIDDFSSSSNEITTFEPIVNSGEVILSGEAVSSFELFNYGIILFDETGSMTKMRLGSASERTTFSTTLNDLEAQGNYTVCAYMEQAEGVNSEQMVGEDIPFVFLP